MRKLKQGDIFEIKIKDRKHYFRYIVKDKGCLRSDVIQCFEYSIGMKNGIKMDIIQNLRTLLYSHTFISVGVELKLWERIGNVPLPEDFEMPFFRKTIDLYSEVKKSFKWHIGQPNKERQFVGELKDEHKTYSYDAVNHPMDIIKIIEIGYDYSKKPE
jgi:hypothetical protein